MRRLTGLALAAVFLIGSGGLAQAQSAAGVVPDLSGVAAQAAQAKATADAAMAAVPLPANVVPPSEASGAATGAQVGRYALEDHIHQRISRVAVVTSDATGNWSASWSSMPLATTPAIFPVAANTGNQPIVCNVATRTTTGATGRCWMARTLPATLTLINALIAYDVFGQSPASTTVMVLALPPS